MLAMRTNENFEVKRYLKKLENSLLFASFILTIL